MMASAAQIPVMLNDFDEMETQAVGDAYSPVDQHRGYTDEGYLPVVLKNEQYQTEAEMDLQHHDDTAVMTTVDSSPLGQGYSAYVTSGMHVPMSQGKIAKKTAKSAMKKIKVARKADDGDDRSQCGDEDTIDIDRIISDDHARISVKILRKVIPKLRIACYFSDEQLSGKRKMKHLWDEKPSDWPDSVAFKDPNNAKGGALNSSRNSLEQNGRGISFKDPNNDSKDARKPGKDELGPMYEFLRQKYLSMKKGHTPASLAAQYNMSYPETTSVAESAVQYYIEPQASQPSYHFAEEQVSRLAYHQVKSEEGEDGRVFSTMATVQPWQHVQPSEDHALPVLAPTKSELPFALMRQQQQQFIAEQPSLRDVQLMVNNVAPVPVSAPAPVVDLYKRLHDKQRQVAAISNNDGKVVTMLNKVQKEVVDNLYEKLSMSETRLCLMFLDAGHQYEALLDVMVVLGKMDVGLLSNGCEEIIKKFNQELCMNQWMMLTGVIQPRLPNSMLTDNVKLTALGFPSSYSDLIAQVLGLTNSVESDPLKASKEKEQAQAETAPSDLGIFVKPGGEALMSNLGFYEPRPELKDAKKDDDSLFDEFFEKFTTKQEATDIENPNLPPQQTFAARPVQLKPSDVPSPDNTADGMDLDEESDLRLSDLVEVIEQDTSCTEADGQIGSEARSLDCNLSSGQFSQSDYSQSYQSSGWFGHQDSQVSLSSSFNGSLCLQPDSPPEASGFRRQEFVPSYCIGSAMGGVSNGSELAWDNQAFSMPLGYGISTRPDMAQPSSLPLDGRVLMEQRLFAASCSQMVQPVAAGRKPDIPIPLCVTDASCDDDFDMENSNHSGRRSRQARGSVSSSSGRGQRGPRPGPSGRT